MATSVQVGSLISSLKVYVNSAGWLLAEQILRLTTGFFVGVLVARHLGPEQFGTLSYLLAFVALFAAVAKLGLDAIVVRELVRRPGDEGRCLSTALVLRLAGATLAFAAIAVAALAGGGEAIVQVYLVVIGASLMFQASELAEFLFQAKGQGKTTSLCRAAQTVLISLLKLVLVLADAGLPWFVAAALLEQAILALLLGAAVRRELRGSGFHFDRLLAVSMLRTSWPLLVSAVATALSIRLDHFLVRRFLGDAEVGRYAAAVALSEAWLFVPTIISAALFPAIVHARASQEEYSLRVRQYYAIVAWTGIGCAAVIGSCAGWIVPLLFGTEFAGAVAVLQVHVWGGVLMALLVASGRALVAEGRTIAVMQRNLLGAVVNVSLNLLLIPSHGIVGAAYASVGGLIAATLLYDAIRTDCRQMLRMKVDAIMLRGLR